MAADNSREVFGLREKSDLFVNAPNFIVRLSRFLAISLKLLRPGDQQAEVRGLRQLRQFRRFRSRQNLRFQTRALKMFRGKLATGSVNGPYEFRVGFQLLQHSHVLTAYRAVRQSGPSSRCYYSSGSDCDGAIDNRQRGLKEIT